MAATQKLSKNCLILLNLGLRRMRHPKIQPMDEDFERIRLQLASRIARWTADCEQFATPIAGLSLYRHAQAGSPQACMLEPAIAFPVQGAKQALLGAERYTYDERRCLITSVDLPAVLQVAKASPDLPYLSAVLKLDSRAIGELMTERGLQRPDNAAASDRSVTLGDTTAALLDAVNRLVGLLDEPDLIPLMAPLIRKEIFCRFLLSESGAGLWQMAAVGSHRQRIGQAIGWLKANFREPLRVDALAALSDMSTSRFHHHFRVLTAMSPLQFQKWLRLVEARRLMVTQGLDALRAAVEVGYGSASQFSREYARQFGDSPRRDVDRLLQRTSP